MQRKFGENVKVKKINKMTKVELEKKLKEYSKFKDSKFYKELSREYSKY